MFISCTVCTLQSPRVNSALFGRGPVLFCTVFFSCIYAIIICFFKAASLDGHMAFLVAVHYVIFYWF